MVTTSIAAVVLYAVLAPGAVATPAWQTDYGKAVAAAAAQHKPMAVFIGQGKTGYEQVVRGGIPGEVGKVLAQDYIPVYIDTGTETGKTLASQFELNKGLVISSQDGEKQAVWHKGELAPTTLSRYLTKCCDSTRVVTTTEIVGAAPPVPVQPSPAFSAPQYFPQQFPRAGFPAAPCLTGR